VNIFTAPIPPKFIEAGHLLSKNGGLNVPAGNAIFKFLI
jgi:hypothetical protein